jgi:glycosyltransferase involved in cell wall biosynthesis
MTRTSVACPGPDPCDHPPIGPEAPFSEQVRRSAPHHARFCRAAAEHLVRIARAVRPDVVVASGLECAAYLKLALEVTSAVGVLDLHNVESPLQAEVRTAIRTRPDSHHFITDDGEALRVVETVGLSVADGVWTCTEQDRQRLVDLHGYPVDRVTVVPNAVPVTGPAAQVTPVGHVLYVGRLDWFPNVDAVEFLLDEVRPWLARRGAGMPIVIAGRNPSPALVGRQSVAGVRLLANPPEIDSLWTGGVLVVPLRIGGGSRLKILEAFAAGCPVVSTAKGIEGIDAEDGVHYLRAESAEAMADAVLALRTDSAQRGRLTRSAYRFVSDVHRPERLVAPIGWSLTRLSDRPRDGRQSVFSESGA